MNISYVLILFVIPFFILNYFGQKAGKEFIRLYKQKSNSNRSLYPFEFVSFYSKRQEQFWKDVPKNFQFVLGILWKDYHDKTLNKAARKVSFYFLASTVLIIIDFLIFGYMIIHS